MRRYADAGIEWANLFDIKCAEADACRARRDLALDTFRDALCDIRVNLVPVLQGALQHGP